jgi:hypothetical protein
MTGKPRRRCRTCSGDKRVLESPQKAPPPAPKRNRNYMSPTKPPTRRNPPAPAPPALQTSAPRPAPTFLLRGRYSQDDDETAAAREEQTNIRRRHRLADRHHEERSPTPSLNTLISRARAPFESPISRSLSPLPRSAMVSLALSLNTLMSRARALLQFPISRSLAPSLAPRSTIVSLAPLVSLVSSQETIHSSLPNPLVET